MFYSRAFCSAWLPALAVTEAAVAMLPHHCNAQYNRGSSRWEQRNAAPNGQPRHVAVQVYEEELVIKQPSVPSVVNISENADPPLRVNSRNVPRRDSLGVAYDSLFGGPLPSLLLLYIVLPPWKASGYLPDQGAANLTATSGE
jgi:hypothetical protein